MSLMEFEVHREANPPRVTLNGEFYGSYLDRDSAVIDAYDAADDWRKLGHEATVRVRDRTSAARAA